VAKEAYRAYLNSVLYSRSAYRRQEPWTGIAMERGKQTGNGNRNGTSEELARPKVEKCRFVADGAVVVLMAAERQQERRASRNRS
jgi:hypothetical protein